MGTVIDTVLLAGYPLIDYEKKGRVVQIIGPVIDVFFAEEQPDIYDGVYVKPFDEKTIVGVVCEVQQIIGDKIVRAIAISATDGLCRGIEVLNFHSPLCVPVGLPTIGRIFNVLGNIVDGGESVRVTT